MSCCILQKVLSLVSEEQNNFNILASAIGILLFRDPNFFKLLKESLILLILVDDQTPLIPSGLILFLAFINVSNTFPRYGTPAPQVPQLLSSLSCAFFSLPQNSI